tara:strand:+ start:168 stop:362 length:195 start_codon:yes stop_codon:yes gene_type:complete
MAMLNHPDTGHFISRAKLIAFYKDEELTRRNLPDDEILPPRAFLTEHEDIVDAAWSIVDTIVSL